MENPLVALIVKHFKKAPLSYEGGGRVSVPVSRILKSPKVQRQVEAARRLVEGK